MNTELKNKPQCYFLFFVRQSGYASKGGQSTPGINENYDIPLSCACIAHPDTNDHIMAVK